MKIRALSLTLALFLNGNMQSGETARQAVSYPSEISAALANPYMGYGLWAGHKGFGNNEKDYTVEDCTSGFGDDAPLFSWVLIDWDWASLEPGEGKFVWQNLDAILNYWSHRGKQFVVRLWVTDDPGWNGRPGAEVLPAWLWKKGLKPHEYTGNGGLQRREPDYAGSSYAAVYLPSLRRFLQAFAARYDKPNSPIIYMQAMGYGHWADWATWYSKYQFPSVQKKHETLARILQIYIDIFHHIRLLEFAGPDWDTTNYLTLDQALYSKALDVATAHQFALIWTGFIDGIGGVYDRATMERFWRAHPIIAEGNWNYDDMKDQHTHGTLSENIAGAVDFHANFFHLYFVPGTYQRAVREDSQSLESGLESGGIGYRLVLTSMSWPEELPAGHLLVVHQTWVNRGAGRLYTRQPLKLYLTDEAGKEIFSEAVEGFDESSWVQGEIYPVMSVFHLPKTIPPRNYNIRIALVDSSGRPNIRLAITGEDEIHRSRVGAIRILASDAPATCDSSFCK